MSDEPDAAESVDMDPADAAKVATGNESDSVELDGSADMDVDLGDMADMDPPTPWWKQTEPNPDIKDVDPVDEWSDYWKEYLMRGGEKAMGADDAWAAMDLFRGVVGLAMKLIEEYDI